MRREEKLRRRAALYGWIKWFPVVIIPFGVLFADAWLTVKIRTNDYEYGRLSQEYQQTADQLRVVRTSLAELQRVPLLVSKAEELGFVIPNPRQVETIVFDSSELNVHPDWPLLLARMEAAEKRNATWVGPQEEVAYSGAWLSERSVSEGVSSGGVAAVMALTGIDPVEDFDSEPMTKPVILEIPREVFSDEPSFDPSESDLLGRL